MPDFELIFPPTSATFGHAITAMCHDANVLRAGDEAFVHYFEEPVAPSLDHVKAKGGPFKSNVVGVEYTPDGIVYSLVHVTDGFKTTVLIEDFVVMQCGCKAKMRLVKQPDADAHAAWAEVLDGFV